MAGFRAFPASCPVSAAVYFAYVPFYLLLGLMGATLADPLPTWRFRAIFWLAWAGLIGLNLNQNPWDSPSGGEILVWVFIGLLWLPFPMPLPALGILSYWLKMGIIILLIVIAIADFLGTRNPR